MYRRAEDEDRRRGESSYQNYVLSWSENILAPVNYDDDARTTLQTAMDVAICRQRNVRVSIYRRNDKQKLDLRTIITLHAVSMVNNKTRVKMCNMRSNKSNMPSEVRHV